MNLSRVYKVNHEKGVLKIYISSYKENMYHGTILHSLWAFAENNLQELELDTFIGDSEETILRQCLEEIEKKIPGGYTVEPPEQKG